MPPPGPAAGGAFFPSTARGRRIADLMMTGVARCGAAGMVALLLALVVVLAYDAWPAMRTFGLGFLLSSEWNPVEGHFGAAPVILGTMVSSALALVIAVPVAIGSAIFLARLAPRWLAVPLSFTLDVLAAIPSIAYGFWGAAVLVPVLRTWVEPALAGIFGSIPVLSHLVSGPRYGSGMLAAGVVLAIMIVPVITAVARDVLRSAPREIEEGAFALGATWWQATRLLLAACRAGLFGAVLLGFARAVGETMAVTMVIGNRDAFDPSLFAPGQSMASLLANEFLEADKPIYLQSLIYVALVLLVATLIINLVARSLIARFASRPRRFHAEAARPAANERTVGAPEPEAATPIQPTPVPAGGPGWFAAWSRLRSRGMVLTCCLSASIVAATLACIVAYIAVQGAAGLDWNFFSKLPGPSGSASGMRNCIVGTLILMAMASAIGVPLGMGCGIYLAEYAGPGRIAGLIRTLVDVLAGTPSIVVGVATYDLLVRPVGHHSGWSGAVALSVLMAPIVARTTEEMLTLVPRASREGSLALGATRAQTLWRVVVPSAAGGIITGILLSVARVAGETAPLLFTALGYDGDVYDPNRPFPALTLKIFAYATSAEDQWRRQAWAGMLVLIAMVLVLNLLVRVVTLQRKA